VDSNAPSSIKATTYSNRCVLWDTKRDTNRALDDCNQAIRLNPDDATTFNIRALVYRDLGDNDRIRLDPKFALAFNGGGLMYRDRGDNDRALADFDEAIRLDPQLAVAFKSRSLVYRDKGDIDRALADCNEAIRLDPRDATAFVNRALMYRDKGDNDRAIADYSEAVLLNPNNAIVFFSRGIACSTKGNNDRASDLDRAMTDFDEAARVDPKNALTFRTRGWANLYGGLLDKALADVERANALDPKDAYAALWLDIIVKRSGLPSRLPQAVSQVDMTKWPAPLFGVFMGELTPAAALAAADDANVDKKKRQVCEAEFFGTELALQRSTKDEAARLFRLAASDCSHASLYWESAEAELKALGETP
jgi:tetratricopeptide (TPR) repeat protein